MIRAQGMVTQLVFEHSLRIRVKAETSSEDGGHGSASTLVGTPETESVAESTADTGQTVVSEGTAVGGNSNDNGAETPRQTSGNGGKKNGKSAQSPSAAKDIKKAGTTTTTATSSKGNFIGKLNNLVTTDLQNIVGARDFQVVLVQIPLMFVIGVWFLYGVLGWSALAGLASMLVLVPLPGYIAGRIQSIEKQKMKAVRFHGSTQTTIPLVFILSLLVKTDARVQTVTESEVPSPLDSLACLRLRHSDECREDDQAFRLGAGDERPDRSEAQRRTEIDFYFSSTPLHESYDQVMLFCLLNDDSQ